MGCLSPHKFSPPVLVSTHHDHTAPVMGCAASTPRAPKKQRWSSRVQLELVSKGRLQDKYELTQKVLGRGSFAVVKHCKEIETGALRACKMVSKYSQDGPTQSKESLNDEIEIFRRMGSHPNILEIFDVYETETIVYIGTPHRARTPA